MSDIVDRLKESARVTPFLPDDKLMREAAAEIEWLREDAERVRLQNEIICTQSAEILNLLPLRKQIIYAERCREFKGPCFCGCHCGTTVEEGRGP